MSLVKVGFAGTALSFESAAAGIAMAAATRANAVTTARFHVDFISDSSWSGCLSLVNLGPNVTLKACEV
jgi:hypothetical protein